MPIEDLLSGRLSGRSLALAARALRQSKIAGLGADALRRDLGITELSGLLSGDEPLEFDVAPRVGRAPRTLEVALDAPSPPRWAFTAARLTQGYAEARITPEQLLQQLFADADRLAQRQPLLACLWTRDEVGAREAARASAARFRAGKSLGPLDGVPVVVKEQLAVRGLPRRLGHELPGPQPVLADATLVARLREAGALILGQTAMTELGLSPIGINPKRPRLRNPHHIERTAGGSSTGSGIAVAVGLSPIGVGADGGGSIRIPAAISGVYGLKPSFGRVSRAGSALSGSVDHMGPLGASTLDLALFLDAVAGFDPRDSASRHAPKSAVRYADAVRASVRGLRLGVDERELRDADPAIQRACEQTLKALVASGVSLVDVTLPLARHAAALGSLTIGAETYATMASTFAEHRDAFGLDVQAFMHIIAQLSAHEYLEAQRFRERMRVEVARVFHGVDALALPTTAKTALPVSDADERTGRIDAAGIRAMCRFTFLANLTGLPAGSAPVGVDAEGLPIGFQIVGDAWDEATVLALLAELERSGAARSPRSPHHLALLGE